MDGGEGRDGARGRIEKMKERLDEEDGKRTGSGKRERRGKRTRRVKRTEKHFDG